MRLSLALSKLTVIVPICTTNPALIVKYLNQTATHELVRLVRDRVGVRETSRLAHTHSLTLSHTHTHTHSLTLSHTLTHTHTHSHSHTHTHSLTHTLSHSLTLTHKRTHTHTHTLSLSLSLFLLPNDPTVAAAR